MHSSLLDRSDACRSCSSSAGASAHRARPAAFPRPRPLPAPRGAWRTLYHRRTCAEEGLCAPVGPRVGEALNALGRRVFRNETKKNLGSRCSSAADAFDPLSRRSTPSLLLLLPLLLSFLLLFSSPKPKPKTKNKTRNPKPENPTTALPRVPHLRRQRHRHLHLHAVVGLVDRRGPRLRQLRRVAARGLPPLRRGRAGGPDGAQGARREEPRPLRQAVNFRFFRKISLPCTLF